MLLPVGKRTTACEAPVNYMTTIKIPAGQTLMSWIAGEVVRDDDLVDTGIEMTMKGGG